MSPEAREIYCKEIRPALISDDVAEVAHSAYAPDYLTEPVNIQEFIENPYYLGNALDNTLFPKVKEDLIELFSGEYDEVLLKGAIGWGKSSMCYVGNIYDLYLVSCLRSPAQSFGLIPGSNVAFINISVTKTLAKKIIFGHMYQMIKRSPYFKENFPWDRNVESEMRFPRGVYVYPVAANEHSLLGEGVFSAVFDEMNFYQIIEHSRLNPDGGTYDQALTLYNRMSRRIRSRMNQRGRLPGHIWMISSSRYPTDFTERKAVEALTDKRIFVREYSAWETKPRTNFKAQTFKVEVGDATRRSRVLVGDEEDVNQSRILEVPEDYRPDFDKDTDDAVREFGGISILAIRPFIGRRDLINDMFAAGERLGLKHPFTDYTITLEGDRSYLIPENLEWVEVIENNHPVKQLPQGPWFAHIDLALRNDACGLAIGRNVGSKLVQKGHGREATTETRPIIRIAAAVEIIAPPRGEILISKVRGLIYAFRNLGMQFSVVTYDSWNSADSIQTLKAEGINAETYSVDKTSIAYEELKNAIYDGRIECYLMPVLQQELAMLMLDEKKHKVDHPPNGKKDVSDAVASVVHHCEEAFATGNTNEWQNATSIQQQVGGGRGSDQDELWDKVYGGIPLTPDEIARL